MGQLQVDTRADQLGWAAPVGIITAGLIRWLPHRASGFLGLLSKQQAHQLQNANLKPPSRPAGLGRDAGVGSLTR